MTSATALLAALRTLADRETVHGLVRGRCCRLLLDASAMDDAELAAPRRAGALARRARAAGRRLGRRRALRLRR